MDTKKNKNYKLQHIFVTFPLVNFFNRLSKEVKLISPSQRISIWWDLKHGKTT